MTPNTDWWIRLARASPAGAAWLYLRELFESDGRKRAVDGPRDVGLTPDRAAELFFRDRKNSCLALQRWGSRPGRIKP